MNLGEIIQCGAADSHSFDRLPYIIAEAGVNHGADISIAYRQIDEAAEGGAHAIKFQTYKAEKLASKHATAYWDLEKEKARSQYELFKRYDSFGPNEFEKLKKRCEQSAIEFLSTPFDSSSAEILNPLMSVFKISSSDITNKPLIDFVCQFDKPILLSTGASDLCEVDRAVSWVAMHNVPIALMHCVLNYPTKDKDANLGMIVGLKNQFPKIAVGYSDHTLPADMKVLELATLLGARILEKHFTHDKTLPGNDHYHAMDKDDLKKLIGNLGRVEALIGKEEKSCLPTELVAKKNARRSLVSSKEIGRGTPIRKDDLIPKRPGTGISPGDLEKLVGRVAAVNIGEDEIIKWEMVI